MNYDQELAAKGKMRTQVSEQVNTEDGRVIFVYRERIVKLAKPVAVKTIKAKTIRPARISGQPSKKQLAIQLYMASSHLPREELVKLFMDNLSMSKAGATTYVYNCKRTV